MESYEEFHIRCQKEQDKDVAGKVIICLCRNCQKPKDENWAIPLGEMACCQKCRNKNTIRGIRNAIGLTDADILLDMFYMNRCN